MAIEMDVGLLVTVAVAVVAAWWTLAKLFISQFEQRQKERFDGLQASISEQKRELDGHMSKQDLTMAEIRRVETELARCQIDAATKYQTKDDAGKQFGQVIQEIRALGTRIDAMHNRTVGANGSAQ